MPTVKGSVGVSSAGVAAGIRSASPQGRAPTPTLGAPNIVSFTSSTSSPSGGAFPEPGGDATLAWSVMNADSVSIDQGVGDVTGTSLVVTPHATTTYTMTATNSATSESATAQALSKVRILVDVSGTHTLFVAGTEIIGAGETIDPSATQEFVLQLQNGTVIQGTYPFAAFQHYGKLGESFEFHADTRVYVRAHTDATGGTVPVIGAAGPAGGGGQYEGGAKFSYASGGGGPGSGFPPGTPGDSCLASQQGGSFRAGAATNSTGGVGGSGGAGSEANTDCPGSAGSNGAAAALVSSTDASVPGRLWFDISTSVNGGVKVIGAGGAGGGGKYSDSVGGDGGDGGDSGLDGQDGDLGSGSGGGHAGGLAGAALYVVTATGAFGIVGDDFGPSFLGNNTSDAGAITEA